MSFLSVFHLLFLCLVLVASSSHVDVVVIDDMSAFTSLTINLQDFAPPSVSEESFARGQGILGGERDSILTAVTGTPGSVLSALTVNQKFSLSNPRRLEGSILLQYDGMDQNSQLNPSGLGNLDLTANHGAMFRFFAVTDLDAEFIINVYSQSEEAVCTRSTIIKASTELLEYVINFKDFTGACDFANVGAITFKVVEEHSVDIEFGPLTVASPNRILLIKPIDKIYYDFDAGCYVDEGKVPSNSSLSNNNNRSSVWNIFLSFSFQQYLTIIFPFSKIPIPIENSVDSNEVSQPFSSVIVYEFSSSYRRSQLSNEFTSSGMKIIATALPLLLGVLLL